MNIGYARVSRQDQKLEPQRDALLADGCERVFEEKISSREAERGALREALDWCREGDVLVVARLDRLGRSLRELIDLVGELEGRGVGFRSLKESLDTTTAGGRLIFHVFGALAEFEREIIRERTMAGLESARARGRHGGRPRALDENRAKLAGRLKREGEHSAEEICEMLGVGRSTLYIYLAGGSSEGRSGTGRYRQHRLLPGRLREVTRTTRVDDRGRGNRNIRGPRSGPRPDASDLRRGIVGGGGIGFAGSLSYSSGQALAASPGILPVPRCGGGRAKDHHRDAGRQSTGRPKEDTSMTIPSGGHEKGALAGGAFNHDGFTVPDIYEAMGFFTEALGFELVSGPASMDSSREDGVAGVFGVRVPASVRYAFLSHESGLRVELGEWRAPGQGTEAPKNSDVGGHHLAFNVPDLDAAIAEVSSRPGVRVLEPSDRGFVYFVTPWGLNVQLIGPR